MNKNEKAMSELQKGIMFCAKKEVENAPFDKTYTCIVTNKDGDLNTYTIKLNNKEYSNVTTMGGDCKIGEIVKVTVEQNNYNNIKILKYTSESDKIVVDDALSTTSTNPVQNKVITSRLDEVFQSVSNGKTLIASAITDKGVDTEATDTFQTMANNIESISTQGGNSEVIITNESIVTSEMIISNIIYIQSTGTQYIDTGILPSPNLRVEMKYQYVDIDISKEYCTFGSWNVDGLLYGVNGGYVKSATHNGWVASTVIPDNNIHIFRVKDDGIYYDETQINSALPTDYSQSIFLCRARYPYPDYTNFPNIKIYYCKLYNNDTLIRDFIPSIDSNNVVCFYDNATQQYYYNQGTGDFIVGY